MPKPEVISKLYANQPSFVAKLFYSLIGNEIQHGTQILEKKTIGLKMEQLQFKVLSRSETEVRII